MVMLRRRKPVDRSRKTLPDQGRRTVYIGLRVRRNGDAQNCNGLNIKALDFTPQEVHQIIVDALTAAAEKAQLEARGRAALDGK